MQTTNSRLRFLLLPALLAVSASMVSCNSVDGSAVPTGGGGNVSLNGGNGAGSLSPVVVGETCIAGDANKICLAMHFVTYKDGSGTPVASPDQAATIVHTMNQLWSQCDIGFQIENYETVDPTASGLAYGAAAQDQLDAIRQTYEDPTNELLGVTTGPWGTTVNAWTNMPGDGLYGAVMEASIVDYGSGIIYAHEFGHYLGLDHVSDTADLMNPVIYTTSTALDSGQCRTARETATSYWGEMIRH